LNRSVDAVVVSAATIWLLRLLSSDCRTRGIEVNRIFPVEGLAGAGNAQVRAHGGQQDDIDSLTVVAVEGMAALLKFAPEIDRLNLACTRPNPFMSSAYLQCYALRSEYFQPGRGERIFLIRQGSRLIGCAPMRRSANDFAMLGPLARLAVRLQCLAPLDTYQPGILAAPQDEERVAAALIQHLCEHERGWGMLEFVGQQPGTALHRAAHAAASRRFRARDFPVEPYTEIAVVWNSLSAYFQSLTKKMRSNVSRQARRLFAAGEVELILAEGAAAVTAWFDAYCDLDRRSWKCGTSASIERNPRRVRFYREIVAGRAGLDPEFVGVLLNGVLIAGLLIGSNASASPDNHGAWCLEMAYDQSLADLGSGQLLLLLAVGMAIEKSHRYLNFMQKFAYYKHRWAAEPIHVVNVQLIRCLSLHNASAFLGAAKRKLQARRRLSSEVPMPRDAQRAGQGRTANPAVTATNRDHTANLTAAALAYGGPGVRRLGRNACRAHLPFEID
jgi:CelD/BcsL family acetyltransferase involved in cellulose biosynthesis